MQIFYFAPWYDSAIIKEQSVDMICSQAVLEHTDNLEYIYESMYRWLKYGGFMSHSIDFECHGTANEWNGHWTYSDLMWKLIRGKRPYLLNRAHSAHINIMKKIGFEIICDIKIKHSFRKGASRIQRGHLAPRFKNLSEDDLTTSRAFIQTIKTHKLD